jgi:acetyl esterase
MQKIYGNPVAIEEAYAATKWVSKNGKIINVDGSRLGVAGDSVSGNMAAAVTQLAKQRGGPHIHFQASFCRVTDADFDTPQVSRLSHRANRLSAESFFGRRVA